MLGFRGGSGVELRAGASVKNASLPQTTRARGRLALASPGARSPARDAGHLLSRRAHTWRPALCAAAATRARPPTSSRGRRKEAVSGGPRAQARAAAGRGAAYIRHARRQGRAWHERWSRRSAGRRGPGRGGEREGKEEETRVRGGAGPPPQPSWLPPASEGGPGLRQRRPRRPGEVKPAGGPGSARRGAGVGGGGSRLGPARPPRVPGRAGLRVGAGARGLLAPPRTP